MSEPTRREFLTTLGAGLLAAGSGTLLTAAEITPAPTKMEKQFGELIHSKLTSGPVDLKQMHDAVQEFGRVVLREQSFTMQLMPPCSLEDSPLPLERIGAIDITTARYQCDMDEIKAGQVDIREDMKRMVESVAVELDAQTVRVFDLMIDEAFKGLRHIDRSKKPLHIAELQRRDLDMADKGYTRGLICLPRGKQSEEMRQWMAFGNCKVYNQQLPPIQAPRIRWVQTVKNKIVRPGRMYFFKDPIGLCVLPQDLRVHLDRVAWQLNMLANLKVAVLVRATAPGHRPTCIKLPTVPQFDAWRCDYMS